MRKSEAVAAISRRIIMGLTELNLGLLHAKPVVLPGGENRLTKLVLVGCGGIGSWLSGGVARIAWELKRMGRPVEVQFWDFDRVTQQNIPRQGFTTGDIGLYKAEALALRFSGTWGYQYSHLSTAVRTRPLATTRLLP
jgi:hypothetical protein